MKTSKGKKHQQMKSEKLLNEEEIISLIWNALSRKGQDPYSDDVAWLQNESARKFLVIKSDMFVSETDAPPGMTLSEMASKAVTACVSDFASKGVAPSFGIVSLAIPKSKSTRKNISMIAKGLASSTRKYGFKVISGDTNSSNSGIVIDFTIGGFADRLVRRTGAKPGDLIGISGRFGLEAAGLKILLQRSKANVTFRKKAIDSVLNPSAKLKLGVEISKYLSGSIDSSDGLAISLYHLSKASGYDFSLETLPMEDGIQKFARDNSLKAEDLVLFGGEEYELVFTFDKKFEKILKDKGVLVIGSVLAKSNSESTPQVSFRGNVLPRKGWIHNL